MSRNTKVNPPLLAFLVCERALLDEDKVATLVRIVDTFNFDLKGVPRAVLHSLVVPLNCMVYTRWGPGEGEYTEELALVDPDGKERPQRVKVTFTQSTGFHFYQIRHQVGAVMRESGEYKFRLYLNGQPVAEHPFRVNIQKESLPSG